jgi:DNA polymerase
LTFFDGDEYRLWDGLSDPFASLVADPSTVFVSHSGFEQAMWHHIMVRRYGFLPIPIGRWRDTQAVCAYFALPLDLERALIAQNLPVTKDKEGQRLVRSLSRPLKTGRYPEITPEIRARVAAYNRTDVEGTVAIDTALGRLPKRERRIWRLDQRINRRGIGIDLDYVRAAKKITDQLFSEAIEEFRVLTDLSPTKVQKVRNWLCENGTELKNLQAKTIEEILKTELPPAARRVLEIRLMVASSSLTKLDAMLACVGSDGRARGLFQYHGATTGRWAGRLLQPQNFPRPSATIEDPEELVAAIKTGDAVGLRKWGEPIEVLVSSLRHAVTAQGEALLGAGDFETVEARIVLALAGQDDKVALLASGVDVYRDVAADIFRLNDKAAYLAIDKKEMTPEQAEMRQVGKNTALGCGFGLSWKGFCSRFGMVEDGLAQRIINTYRNEWAPKVPQLWYDLERTAIRAMQNPGAAFTAACGIRYWLETKAGMPFLVCRLLNGKRFRYADAQLEMREDAWGRRRPAITYQAVKDHKWRKVIAWHGHLTENAVQAHARELLVDAMLRFEDRGFPIVLHCHDEIVVEHPEITASLMQEIMSEPPQWAIDLGVPIAVEAWVGRRYRK